MEELVLKGKRSQFKAGPKKVPSKQASPTGQAVIFRTSTVIKLLTQRMIIIIIISYNFVETITC